MPFRLVSILVPISPAVVAVFGSWFSYEFLYWNVPRRHPFVPSVLVALMASYLIYWVATQLGKKLKDTPKLILVIAATFIGVIGALFVAVKVGTPAHATVIIVCDSIGTPNQVDENGRVVVVEEREDELRGYAEEHQITYSPPPAVWPEHFFIAQEGSVSWLLYGEPGTKVQVLFDKGYDPFSVAGGRDSPSSFIGVIPPAERDIRVPGIIVAGPVVRGGRGNYTIIVTYPDGSTKEIDPTGEGPRKHA